ncbi:DUF4256 domain-containing protein [Candidatus Gracilibacteria bacterium]|nr:DUF4256 domain-containing protein [Candidatus Gracilibacteria bacterium]
MKTTNAEILKTLRTRFAQNMKRHPRVDWDEVETKLASNPKKLATLAQMEETGGEPDVVVFGKEITFCDCSPESPKGRVSLCYDDAALKARKEHKPIDSAMNRAGDMGIEILDEEQYRYLQTLGEFDKKTSTWIKTPASIRKLGGALFCDRRYDTVFTYHNGAESYYAARGFRGKMKV